MRTLYALVCIVTAVAAVSYNDCDGGKVKELEIEGCSGNGRCQVVRGKMLDIVTTVTPDREVKGPLKAVIKAKIGWWYVTVKTVTNLCEKTPCPLVAHETAKLISQLSVPTYAPGTLKLKVVIEDGNGNDAFCLTSTIYA